MIRLTSRPATRPASFVAWRWSSLKYAGTVMTALSTVSPRYASASDFSFCRIIALISGGLYCLPPASTRASPFGPLTTLYGTIASSSLTSRSLRPMKRLIEKTVFAGLVTAWRFATVPTRRSPPCVKATTDGVVRPPSAFSMTVGSPPSRTAMHEFVVPRSMPMVLPMMGWGLLGPCGRNLSGSMADLCPLTRPWSGQARAQGGGERLRRPGALREEQRRLGELELEQLRAARARDDIDPGVGQVAAEALAHGAQHAVGQGALGPGGLARGDRLGGEEVAGRLGTRLEDRRLADRVAE